MILFSLYKFGIYESFKIDFLKNIYIFLYNTKNFFNYFVVNENEISHLNCILSLTISIKKLFFLKIFYFYSHISNTPPMQNGNKSFLQNLIY